MEHLVNQITSSRNALHPIEVAAMDLDRTTRAFAGDISFMLSGTNYGLHFMMMYMLFDYEQLATN